MTDTTGMQQTYHDVYNAWERGDLTAQEALEGMARELHDLNEEYDDIVQAMKHREAVEKDIKTHSETIARESGKKTTNAGGLEFTIVERNPVTTFESAQVETAITDMAALVAKMRENGLETAAAELAGIMGNLASSKTTKSGSSYLRVAKQREPVKAKK